MSMVQEIDTVIDYSLQNRDAESHRRLLSFAALDMGPGHVLQDSRCDPSWFKYEVRHAVSAAIPESGTCALLDTTTLLNAYRILHPDIGVDSLPAGAIFDLATFVSACLFEDNLLFLENSAVSASEVTKLIEGLPVVSIPWEGESDLSLIIENSWTAAALHAWSVQSFNIINCIDPVKDLLKRKGTLLDADESKSGWQLKMLERLAAV